MSYSSIGLISIAVLLIINHDVLLRRIPKEEFPAQNEYRAFLLSMLAFYLTDVGWGLFEALKLIPWMYADTVAYFVAMAFSLLFWARFVVAYLEDKGAFRLHLLRIAQILVLIELVALCINSFRPIVFWIDASGAYRTGFARDLWLLFQILMFLITSIYTMAVMLGVPQEDRVRYMAICLFGLVMVILLAIQLNNPLLPLYSTGFLLGNCLMYSFVVEGEKAAYRRKLEAALQRERQQQAELNSARQLAYRDALTGVKSKLAYAEAEEALDRRIAEKEIGAFAVAVFDCNELKRINDSLGHEAGDRYIVDACHLICEHFKHSPVFRVGGDEFAALLEGEDYKNRAAIVQSFDGIMESNVKSGGVVVSLGLAEYDAQRDNSCGPVFSRADKQMYARKHQLKAMGARQAEPVNG